MACPIWSERGVFCAGAAGENGIGANGECGAVGTLPQPAGRGWPGPFLDGLAGSRRLAGDCTRLLRVQIEHAPAIDVIRRYDSDETLFLRSPLSS